MPRSLSASILSLALRSLACLGVGACASPPPAVQTGPAAEVTFDGLTRVEHSRFARVWVRRGTDFSVYRKLMVLPAEIAYQKPPVEGRETDAGYPLDAQQMAKFRELLSEVFRKELSEVGGWQIVDEPAPDVLLLQGGLIDLVVKVPPRKASSARGGTWVASYGAMTLVIQLYDSQTHQILARVAERREVEPASGLELSQVELSAPIELRIFFERWAKRLREGLDAVREPTS